VEAKEAQILGRLARNDRVINFGSNSTRCRRCCKTGRWSSLTRPPTRSRLLDLLASRSSERAAALLAAGRWTANKGFDVLIDAWNQAPSGQLTIVGGPPPSGGSLDIDQLVANSPQRDSITLVREVDSILPLLAKAMWW
jgi:glycosyltransferase involved in cell wall biosynthesis